MRIDISGPFSEKTLKFMHRQIRDDLISRGLANVEFQGAREAKYGWKYHQTTLENWILLGSSLI